MVEMCERCDEPTGRAGESDDSIYCDNCERGPFCEDCVDDFPAGLYSNTAMTVCKLCTG